MWWFRVQGLGFRSQGLNMVVAPPPPDASPGLGCRAWGRWGEVGGGGAIGQRPVSGLGSRV